MCTITYLSSHITCLSFHLTYLPLLLTCLSSHLLLLQPITCPPTSYDLLPLCCRELLSAMLEEVSSEYVLLAVHGIGYLARYLHHQHQHQHQHHHHHQSTIVLRKREQMTKKESFISCTSNPPLPPLPPSLPPSPCRPATVVCTYYLPHVLRFILLVIAVE